VVAKAAIMFSTDEEGENENVLFRDLAPFPLGTGETDMSPWEDASNSSRKRRSDIKNPRLAKRATADASENLSNTEIPLSNTFSPLADISDTIVETDEAADKVPPIYLNGVTNASALIRILSEKGGPESFTLKSRANKIIINAKTPAAFRSFIRYLEAESKDFHTYQLPSEKNPKVVIRGLHFSTSQEEIKEALAANNYTVLSATNVLSRRQVKRDENNHEIVTRHPLPLFFVEISRDTFDNKIYDLKYLLFHKITIEEPYRKNVFPQCTRCQSYLHTKAYCHHPFRCVRCGQNHESNLCQKSRDTPATCANCQQQHPANYKGCQTYQNLKRQRQRGQYLNSARPPTTFPPLDNTLEFPSLRTNGTTTRPPASQETVGRHRDTAGQATRLSSYAAPDRTYSTATSHNEERRRAAPSGPHHGIPTDRDEGLTQSQSTTHHGDPVREMVNFVKNFQNFLQPLFTLLTQLTQFTQTFIQKYDP
jgi:hypothetical protein